MHFIPDTLEKERVGPSGPVPQNSLWKPENNTVRPRVLARLKAFLKVTSRTTQLPNMTHMVHEILEKLEALWVEPRTLEFYPAFMNK